MDFTMINEMTWYHGSNAKFGNFEVKSQRYADAQEEYTSHKGVTFLTNNAILATMYAIADFDGNGEKDGYLYDVEINTNDDSIYQEGGARNASAYVAEVAECVQNDMIGVFTKINEAPDAKFENAVAIVSEIFNEESVQEWVDEFKNHSYTILAVPASYIDLLEITDVTEVK